jgi:hypothetical protein
MKRPTRLVIGLVLILVLVGAGTILLLDSIARQAIEGGGSHALGVETRLDNASIGLVSGEFGLRGLAVANPPGFERPDFFTLRSARLELPLRSLLEPRVTIPALELEGIALDLERSAKGTNYGVILDNLSRFESGPGKAGGEGKKEEVGGKTYKVQKLVIRDVRASVNLVPGGGDLTRLALAVPEIVVEDLASDMTMPELCALVVKVVIQAAIKAGEGVVPGELLADLRGRMDGLKGVARVSIGAELGKFESGLREQAKKLGPEAEKALDEASGKLDKALDGLLDKDKKDKKKGKS